MGLAYRFLIRLGCNNLADIKCLKCVKCEKEYEPEVSRYLCDYCGGDGLLDVLYDYERVVLDKNKKWGITPLLEYFLPLMPVKEEFASLPLKVGFTPLYKFNNLEIELGLNNLYLKDDTHNPSASFKDRASIVAISKALEYKKEIISCASTGNAASSLACLAAGVSIKTVIFVPKTAPKAKISQLFVYGAMLFMVDAPYDTCFDLSWDISMEYGWYNRNTGFNPYMLEGKKTVALEIFEQLGGKAPDQVVVSVGDGCILSGVYKGFWDLRQLGLIDKLPRLIGVQAEGAAPLYKAYKNKTHVLPVNVQTIADSISVGNPRAAGQCLRAVNETGGQIITVSDEEIINAIPYLAGRTGIFMEPAASAAFAGLLSLVKQGLVSSEQKTVVILTGNGLKDVEAVSKIEGKIFQIKPDISEVKKAWNSMKCDEKNVRITKC